MNHAAGSLEELVENLVKTWEMEATHKTDFEQVFAHFQILISSIFDTILLKK